MCHIILGVLVVYIPFIALLWGLVPLTLGLWKIVANKNRNEEALFWSAYSVGLELLLRITQQGLTYEIGKYSVVILLLVGMAFERRKNYYSLPVLYFFLLIPSVFISLSANIPGSDLRKIIIFNLLGPLTLCISVWYFSYRKLTPAQVWRFLRSILLPIVSVAVLIFLKTPDFSKIKFTAHSNFETSGGFGPNQVATILGLGVVVIGYCLIKKITLFPSWTVSVLILLFLCYQAILTFSRGGIISAIISLFICIVSIFLINRQLKILDLLKITMISAVFSIIVFFGWNYINTVTKGQLNNRYTGRNTLGKEVDITTGREVILNSELQIFSENLLLGIGLGMGNFYREEMLDVNVSSHNELSRMLAEHGLLGGVALFVLICILLRNFSEKWKYNKMAIEWLLLFGGLALLTLNHSAMRLAMPGYLMGVSLIFFGTSDQKVSNDRDV